MARSRRKAGKADAPKRQLPLFEGIEPAKEYVPPRTFGVVRDEAFDIDKHQQTTRFKPFVTVDAKKSRR